MRVFLDMDEVLVDFVDGCCAAHNVTKAELNARRVPGEWSILPALGITDEQMWKPINEDGSLFWEALESLPWMDTLVQSVAELTSDWHIVTAPSRCDTSYTGKVRWLKKQFGQDFDRFLLTPHKQLFANPYSVLIDDRMDNVTKFVQYGGHGILFPTLGGPLHAQAHDPLLHVYEQLVKYNRTLSSPNQLGAK